MIEIVKVANGMGGAGSGYDAEALRVDGRIIVALYRVSSKEWVAMGECDDEGQDLREIALSVANGPGAWELSWAERDPEAYETLAVAFDAAVAGA